jgi:hypothetical protein
MRGVISSLLVIISVVDRELFIPDLVPDPTVEKFRIRFRIHIRIRIQNIFSLVKKIIFVQNFAFLMLEIALLPRKS